MEEWAYENLSSQNRSSFHSQSITVDIHSILCTTKRSLILFRSEQTFLCFSGCCAPLPSPLNLMYPSQALRKRLMRCGGFDSRRQPVGKSRARLGAAIPLPVWGADALGAAGQGSLQLQTGENSYGSCHNCSEKMLMAPKGEYGKGCCICAAQASCVTPDPPCSEDVLKTPISLPPRTMPLSGLSSSPLAWSSVGSTRRHIDLSITAGLHTIRRLAAIWCFLPVYRLGRAPRISAVPQ